MSDILAGDATDLSARLATGAVSAVEVMEATLDRIGAENGRVNAVVSLMEDDRALDLARAADAGPRRGWLHGSPLAVKDLADAAGFPTTMGSPIFPGTVAAADCGVVARMKAAGGLVIGKTNTPAFGLGSHTVNPVFGATRNPLNPALSAGGSSGGAAAALATGMVAVADGSDMMGSLRNPAAWCGIYGFRPTWGRVPGDAVGDVYLHSLATLGPMARSVRDLAALLRVQEAQDPRVPGPGWTGLPEGAPEPMRPARVGWLADWQGALPIEEGIISLCEEALAQFSHLGSEVEALGAPFSLPALWESWTTLRAFAVTQSLWPLWQSPDTRAALNPQACWEIAKGQALTAADVQAASVIRSQWLAAAVTLFERYDVLVMPSAQCFAFDVGLSWPEEVGGVQMDTYHRWMEVVVPVSLIGLPALNVPVGVDAKGRAMGMQIIGKPGADWDVLRVGEIYSRALA